MLVVEMQSGTATLENSLTVSHRAKHTFAILSSDPTPQNLP